jgi:hypothetical protein
MGHLAYEVVGHDVPTVTTMSMALMRARGSIGSPSCVAKGRLLEGPTTMTATSTPTSRPSRDEDTGRRRPRVEDEEEEEEEEEPLVPEPLEVSWSGLLEVVVLLVGVSPCPSWAGRGPLVLAANRACRPA